MRLQEANVVVAAFEHKRVSTWKRQLGVKASRRKANGLNPDQRGTVAWLPGEKVVHTRPESSWRVQRRRVRKMRIHQTVIGSPRRHEAAPGCKSRRSV